MCQTDPIADFITVIRNGVSSRKASVEVEYSKIKASITEILEREGFIDSWEILDHTTAKGSVFKRLKLNLRYADDLKRVSPLNALERISKPGRRVYVNRQEIPRVRGGFGLSILSTSRGVLSDKDARKHNVGGELLVRVY
jgi:small subunit ribosomal protein S8